MGKNKGFTPFRDYMNEKQPKTVENDTRKNGIQMAYNVENRVF